jgi:hypothetical protein
MNPALLPIDQPEHSGENQANDQRCRQRQIQPKVPAFDDDVAGQTAEARLGEQRPQRADDDQNQTKKDQPARHYYDQCVSNSKRTIASVADLF